jgi:hypothetical protein
MYVITLIIKSYIYTICVHLTAIQLHFSKQRANISQIVCYAFSYVISYHIDYAR